MLPAVCALVAIFAVFALAHPATVNGRRVPLWSATTAGDCARRIGIDTIPGDLLDVRGTVIAAGAGAAPHYVLNGVPVGEDHRVARGDRLTIRPAGDMTEPTVLKAGFITPELGPGALGHTSGLTETGIGGIRYAQYGAVSGQLAGICMAAVVPTAEKPPSVALTFDDGPSPTYTPQILSILQQHEARATFFMLGCWAVKHKDLVSRVVAAGHEIGNHTWSHPDCTKLSSSALASQLHRWEDTIEPLTGKHARYFRPPYGASNGAVRATAGNLGYKIAMWTADTNDWRRPGADAIYNRACNGARDGAIILMHDGGGSREQTVAAVKRLVPALQKKGYRLVTLSQLQGYDPWDGEFVINTDAGQVKMKPTTGLHVVINGRPVDMPVEPVKIDGQLLLPAKPTLPLLGCTVAYEKQDQSLRIGTPLHTLQMNLNLRTLQVGSEKVFMSVPAILYKGTSMVPLWVLVDYCGASANLDEKTRTLYITGTFGPAPSLADSGGLWRAVPDIPAPRLPSPSEPSVQIALRP
jgi:peptidoglycan/xylan/chitin deacetylase (PgdA/CDA1 family)